MPLQLFRRAAGSRRLRPHEVCRRLTEDLNVLSAGRQGVDATPGAATGMEQPLQPAQRAASEDVQKQLHDVLEVLEDAAERSERGSYQGDHQPDSAKELVAQFLAADLPSQLVASLVDLEFEAKKEVISFFSTIVRLGPHLGEDLIQEYVRSHPGFFKLLVEGHGKPEIATQCGVVLRSCARHRQIVEAFLASPEVPFCLIAFMRHESFDISSDAFSSFHDILLTHKSVSASFLDANFQEFFTLFNGLLQSNDYVTQRQALKLLSEILLDRAFVRAMLSYIGDEQFLQIHMNLLRANSKAIQFEAFHIFKIFVANPQRPPRVQQILYKNKDKLVKLLDTLRPNRADDRQFAEDKSTVIGKLQALEPPERAPSKVHGALPPNPVITPTQDIEASCQEPAAA